MFFCFFVAGEIRNFGDFGGCEVFFPVFNSYKKSLNLYKQVLIVEYGR